MSRGMGYEIWDAYMGNWGQHPGANSFVEKKPCKPFSDFRDMVFDFEVFYSFFPEFDGADAYPQSFVSGAAKQASMFVKPTWCRELDGPDRAYAYYLTVAHMAVLIKRQQSALAGGATPGSGVTAGMDGGPGVLVSASVGGVNISKGGMNQPKSFWEEWFYQTPYGRTLLAFLTQQVAAGLIYEGEENIADCLRD